MAVRSFESLKLIVLTLIAVVCARNEPEFEYTCDQSGMHINMTFDHPFRGLVYIKGYSKDVKCRLALQVPVLEASFNIPLMACDMYRPQFAGSSPWIMGIIVVQQHPLLPTIHDTTEPVACAVEGNSNVTNWSEVSRNAQEFLRDYPNVISWLEFGLTPGIFDEETENYPNTTNFIAFRVYGASRFNDMLVTECIAHNEQYIGHNTSIYQMTEQIGCANAFTETLSPFNVTKSSRDVITGSYAEFNPLNIPRLNESFISCSAVLCSDKCQCPQNSSSLGYQLIATRKVLQKRYKRSASEETTAPSNRNYGIRNRFLRSTIKALTERLMNSRRQPRIEKADTDFEKRFMPNLDEVTTAKLAATHIKSDPSFPERVPATESNKDLNFNIESQDLDESNVSSAANLSAMFIPELELEKFMTRVVEISTESTLHHKRTFKDPLSVTLVSEDEIEKLFHLFEQTTEGMSNPVTTFKDLNEDLQQKNVLIKTHEDFIPTANVTIETGGLKPGDMIKTVDNEKQEQNDCVPRLRFVIVTVSLSFIVVCLILGSCGLVLYTSKEKKKRALDNFLLYNFY